MLNKLAILSGSLALIGLVLALVSWVYPDKEPQLGTRIERQGEVVIMFLAGLCFIGLSIVANIVTGLYALIY